FKYACDFLGVELKNAFFIGDSLYEDALGSQNAGMRGIWLNRSSTLLGKEHEELQRPPMKDLKKTLAFLTYELSKEAIEF
ncbi:MAG: HAD hydrolase-like protein, partial [Silvanigrellaceae bacterium]|nr:HAD hydrolase-like protein [Silvanigrellaceae bacterium]